ncbi:MAG: hypothetical protein V1742_05520, partial [Pseudomonadota bacterium]
MNLDGRGFTLFVDARTSSTPPERIKVLSLTGLKNISNRICALPVSIDLNAIQGYFILVLYRLSLDLAYYFAVTEVYDYMYMIRDFSWIKMIESYVAMTLIYLLLPKRSERVSSLIVQLLLVTAY